MIEDHIEDGDYVIITKQESAENGQRVIAMINGEVTLKKYFKKKDVLRLDPANSHHGADPGAPRRRRQDPGRARRRHPQVLTEPALQEITDWRQLGGILRQEQQRAGHVGDSLGGCELVEPYPQPAFRHVANHVEEGPQAARAGVDQHRERLPHSGRQA